MLLLVSLPNSPANADSTGPINAGSGANMAGVGTVAWTDPGNITAPGLPYAVADFTHFLNQTSNYLVGSNYGFNIPAGSTILGITVVIQRSSNTASSLEIQ